MSFAKSVASLILFIFFGSGLWAQPKGVAVVLSGGGASAYAHIGFLKALEENNIPIDYIAGASMGAIIGGLYASGFSPDEIEQILGSQAFLEEINGLSTAEVSYFFKKPDQDASWVHLKFRGDGQLQKNLPTHLIDPLFLDYELLRLTGDANAIAKQNFDSLFIPFRCVASDIENKRAVILKDGDLNRAIRASSTYPFYVRATEYKDQLLFDGGLYNNFPVDVAIAEFNPKVLLGCNVSYNYEAPEIDDLLSQVKNMLVSKTDYTLQGMPGIIVEPENDITTFDFERFPEAIASGYETTLSRMDSIKVLINQQDSLQTASKRKAFNTRKVPYKIARLSFKKLNKNQESYLRKGIVKKQNQPYLADLRSNFLSLKEDPFIRYLYPDLKYNAADSNYTMDVDVDLEKSIVISFGGNVSNKAINTGFVSADWVHLGRFGTILSANTYFGKYYSSFKLDAKLYFEGKTPWVLNPYVVFNRWDYFKSRTSFFEDIQPAFVIENERFGGLSISLPENHSGKFVLDIRAFSNKPNYYLTRDFSNADTADQSLFQGGRIAFSWLQSTLDQKQYPSKGHKTSASISMVQGLESYIPGSTSEAPAFSNELKSWIQFRAAYQEFFEILPRLSTYPMAEIRLASFYTFSNFRSTKIFQPQYNPLTESPTLYLPRYRALNYGGLGLGFNYELSDRFSIRTQHHMFQPVNELEEGFRDQTTLGSLLADRFYIGSFAAVFQSPIGPLALNLNYYDKSSEPWSFMINFGYILFNNRSL